MEHYALKPDESVLYKSECYVSNKNEKLLESLSTRATTELILTNQNVVFINKSKKLFAKEDVAIEAYPIAEIKIYNDVPQIKQDDSRVEIFFTSGEKAIGLPSKHEARKFINTAIELLTGKTVSVRVSDKVKGAVGLVDDTLGINTVGTIKNVAENGLVGTVLGGFGKRSHAKSIGPGQIAEVLTATSDLFNKKTDEPKSEAESIDNQIETLKKLKNLLDTGVITQDEFDAKKKQVMGL